MRSSLHASLLLLFCSPLIAATPQIGDHAPVPPSWSQRPGQSPTPNVRQNEPIEDPADRMRRLQVDKLNAKHQEQAKLDAARLLELATTLKQQVDALNGTTTSAKIGGDADKIIGLAKSVKSNLRQF